MEADLHRAAQLLQELAKPIFVARLARGLFPDPGAEKRYVNALTEIDTIARRLYGSSRNNTR